MSTYRGLLMLFAAGACVAAVAQERQALGRAVPTEIMDPPWLDDRRDAQVAEKDKFRANVDFSFEDRIGSSWITFRNRVVEDAAMTYKAVHYDHGTGIAVADVDGDGREDILFVNQVGPNALLKNLGGGRFVDVTDDAGVGAADRISVGASFADTDNDGDPDLYITAVRSGNLFFENVGGGRFEEKTAQAGLGYQGHSSGAVFFDFDRDGLLDLYLTNVGEYTSDTVREGNHEGYKYQFFDGHANAFSGHLMEERQEYNRLFRNLGDNRFEDVTGIIEDAQPSWSGDATAVDINGDGWQDLYVLNMQGHDEYYENREGKGFVRRSRELFPKTSWGAMGVKAFDWNNDGDLDIYVTDMHSDMSQLVGPDDEHKKSDVTYPESHLRSNGNSIFGNSFFDADGKGGFVEISDAIGAENYWPWGISVADLNADGFQDVFVSLSMNYPFRYQTNGVLINDLGKRFRQAEFILGVEPRRDRRTARPWFGLDCATEAHAGHALCREAGQPVLLEVWGSLGSRSAAIFDIDGDGDLDIVTNEHNSEPMVLVSDLAQRDQPLSFLKVSLAGSASNAQGLGARVTVRTEKGSFVQVVDGKSGYLSQSDLPLYFGLDGAEQVESVTVAWPSGRTQSVGPLDANVSIKISEPDAAAGD